MTHSRTACALAALIVFFLPALAQEPAPAPAAPSGALEAGWKAYAAADYLAALRVALDARRASPSDAGAAELWGRACLAAGEPARAVSALATLSAQRGTVEDYRLLWLACSLSGRTAEAADALAKAETAKGATPEALYALAWMKPDAAGRLALLKRIAHDFPSAQPALAEETAFWEQRAGAVLRQPAKPLPADGIRIKLKTLYDMEWAVCRTSTGQELWLMVDTACPQTVLSRDTAKRLQLPVVQGAYAAAGAYPQEPAPAYTVLESLDLGGFQVRSVPAVVVEDPQGELNYREGRAVLKGILGMDLLRGLKVRFDRHKNVLTLLPPDTPAAKLLGGESAGWRDFPALSVYDQVLVPSMVGAKNPVLGLLDTGCLYVMACERAIPGSGLTADSRNSINLNFANFAMPVPEPLGERAAGQAPIRAEVLGWLEECLPPAGTVRTVPKDATVGFADTRFSIRDLPLYPRPLGSDVPVSVVVGRKITDVYALALDLGAGRVYVKQVLF